jgi:hypothetical protein
LWNRNYSYDTEARICPSIESSGFKMTVVGHCQTNGCNIGEPGKPAPNNLQTILDRQKANVNRRFRIIASSTQKQRK